MMQLSITISGSARSKILELAATLGEVSNTNKKVTNFIWLNVLSLFCL